MAPLILALFLILPLVEIAVYVEVGRAIGVGPTIALTVLSSLVGLALMRVQGLATLARARETIARRQSPVDELLDGLCILLAGGLLFVPGFVTDALGLALFVPAIRRRVRRGLWRSLERRERRVHGTVIETSYTVVDGQDEPAPSSGETERRRLEKGGRG